MIVLLIIVSTNLLFAQQQVTGTVKDSNGNPVISALVSITDTISGTGFYFSHTDMKGQFKLQVSNRHGMRNLAVKIVATGYTKGLCAIPEPLQTVHVILQRVVNVLPPVTVQNSSVVRVKGDTISYTVSSFSDQQDKVIGDVLKKIPGIEISDNGTIMNNYRGFYPMIYPYNKQVCLLLEAILNLNTQ